MLLNKRLFSAAIINLALLSGTSIFPVLAQNAPSLPINEGRTSTRAAYKVNFSTYYLSAYTDNNGYFSVPHGLSSSSGIYGLQVAVRHVNGNWHTLEYSHTVDNRFWWNSTYVQGVINSPNFRNRPVYIILTVYP
jgi:hypothetical protein